MNGRLGLIAATCNDEIQNYKMEKIVDLHNQTNYVCLINVESDGRSEKLSPNMIKQRSDSWFEERQKPKVTGSTIYRALGLSTLKGQQEHFKRTNKIKAL